MPYLKMLWTTESPTPQVGSWDFWKSVSGTLFSVDGIPLVKTNNKIAYYGYYEYQGDLIPLIISPDEQAVYTSYNGSVFNRSDGSVTDVNGFTWYYSICGGNVQGSSIDKNCQVPELEPWGTPSEDAANTMIDLIYSVPFHEDYQAGQYVLNRTDKGRTVRKVLGLWLAFTVSNYSSPNVQYISDNADTIINDIVTKLSASTDFYIHMYARYDNVGRGVYINVYYGNNVSGITASIIQKSIYRGLEYYAIGATTPQSPFTNLYSLYVNYGTPTTTETTGTYYFQTIGIYSTNLYDKDITNMGIDL